MLSKVCCATESITGLDDALLIVAAEVRPREFGHQVFCFQCSIQSN